jgi:hypothetical protein
MDQNERWTAASHLQHLSLGIILGIILGGEYLSKQDKIRWPEILALLMQSGRGQPATTATIFLVLHFRRGWFWC